MDRRFWLGLLAYLLPSFPIAYAWHLVIFTDRYDALEMYREDVIIPLGLASMLVQGAAFSWLYASAFAPRASSWLRSGLAFGAFAGALSWSFTTIAVAAKNVMTSVPDYVVLETAFTLVQFAVAGPLIAFAHRSAAGS
jgi:hypothetical protein